MEEIKMIKLTEKQEDKLTAKQLWIYNALQNGVTKTDLVNQRPNTTINTIEKAIASIEKKLNIKM
jgi:DNA-binding NarL/FixJ family response regulator